MAKRNQHIGSSLDDLLQETGELSEVHAVATKSVIVWQITQTIKAENISKSKMAKMMSVSRSSLDKLLDPDNTAVTLNSLFNAVSAVGKTLHIEIS